VPLVLLLLWLLLLLWPSGQWQGACSCHAMNNTKPSTVMRVAGITAPGVLIGERGRCAGFGPKAFIKQRGTPIAGTRPNVHRVRSDGTPAEPHEPLLWFTRQLGRPGPLVTPISLRYFAKVISCWSSGPSAAESPAETTSTHG